ncbi:MAG TPA: winged helix DNA-binding domain-containing protein [Anaerolineae bacterium]|nr:winged helix DNA-binding domain-containing protein [Anaerolineae bacterium]
MSGNLSTDQLKAHRRNTFRLSPDQQVETREEAVSFVNERGFVFFWPIQGIVLPNLWQAVAGDRAVASEHDDPGHITWGWKDASLGERIWYYAKILRRRATIVSLETAPYFYALSENYGSPEEDYLIQYEQGRMTQEAKSVYETLLHRGPLDTVALRKASRLSSRESDYRFNRALVALQTDFKILPIGVAQAGAWNYAFVYDLVPRHFQDLPEQARFIQENQARSKLVGRYLESVGAAQLRDVTKLFGWPRPAAEKALHDLIEGGSVQAGVTIDDEPGTWYALTNLLGGSAH